MPGWAKDSSEEGGKGARGWGGRKWAKGALWAPVIHLGTSILALKMFLQFSAQLSTAGVLVAAGLFFCSWVFFFSWLLLFLLLWVFNFLSHILSWMYSCHLSHCSSHIIFSTLNYFIGSSSLAAWSSSCLTLSSSCHIIFSPPTALTWFPPPPLGLAGPSFYPSWLRMAFFSLLRITDLMICNGYRFLGCWVPVIFLKIL